mgnify:CR=1 FL=1
MFKPTTDLHRHFDAQSAEAIKTVSMKHDLKFADKTIDEIREITEVVPGSGFDKWYAAHTRAREAVFVKPEVFEDVAREAVKEAQVEGLETRILRFSLSMPMFCYKAKHGKRADLNDPKQRKEFLDLVDSTIYHLAKGSNIAPYEEGKVKTPLVFSLSYQDIFFDVMDDIASVTLNHVDKIKGIDLCNEQFHRRAEDYKETIDKIREGGITGLTMHVGEKWLNKDEQYDKSGRKNYSAVERINSGLKLNPNLLGHAIFAAVDQECMENISKSGAVIELCPSSTMYSKDLNREVLKGSYQNFPLKLYQSYKIPCTINTDVPDVVENTLAAEFELMRDVFNLSDVELQDIDSVAKETAKRVYGA